VSEPVEYLDPEDLIRLATGLFGDPPPIRDVGQLGSAAARPETTVFGEDAYPDLWTKAAALLHSILKNHALVDGNKRLGWLATATFLEINGVGVTHVTNDAVYDFVISVTVGGDDIDGIARAFRRLATGGPGVHPM
jgi:death-on-curing protein